jgi:4-amino-4-deoxy-L-arabinose transferase-like glycosyltransferase
MASRETSHPSLSQSGKFVIAIFSAAAVLRIASFFLSENAGGDALSRAFLTARWLQHPTRDLHFDVWLPIHFWLMAVPSVIVGDVELGSRLLSLVLGILSVGLVWLLTKELDGRGSAVFSTIIFAFYSLHIAYSTTSSSDAPYIFFVLGGLALFFRARQTEEIWALCLGGISLTLGAGIRYEAWIFIAGLNAILLLRRRFKSLVFFLLTSGAWPVFWMIYEWITRGHPLYSPKLNYSWVANDLNFYGTSLTYRLLLPPGVIFITLTPIAILGALLALRQVWRKKGLLMEFLFVAIFFTAIQFYQIAMGGTMSYARYTLTLGTMVAVLAGIGLYHSFPKWAVVVAALMLINVVGLFLLATINNPYTNKIRSVAPVLHFTTYLEETGKYLKDNMKDSDAVVLDEFNYETNQIAAVAGMPLLGSERVFVIPDRTDPEKQRKKLAELFPYLQTRRPSYLVYAREGELRQVLPFPTECSSKQVGETRFVCVFQNDHYQIYKIEYPN